MERLHASRSQHTGEVTRYEADGAGSTALQVQQLPPDAIPLALHLELIRASVATLEMRAANLSAHTSGPTPSSGAAGDGTAASDEAPTSGTAASGQGHAIEAEVSVAQAGACADTTGGASSPGAPAPAAATGSAARDVEALTQSSLFRFKRASPRRPRCLRAQPLKPGVGPLGPVFADGGPSAGTKRRRTGGAGGSSRDDADSVTLDVDGQEPRYMARGQMLPSIEMEARRIHDELVQGITTGGRDAAAGDEEDGGETLVKRRRTGPRRARPAPSRVRLQCV